MLIRILLALCLSTSLVGCGDDSSEMIDENQMDDVMGCPDVAPEPQDSCTGEDRCEYGSETCRGETFPEYVCVCDEGAFECFFTDACLGDPNS